MPLQPVDIGLFGKIPSRGDFVQKGLPKDFVQAWDGWLAAGLAHSHEILAGRWDDAFMTAPLWRFVLAEGLCGAGAACGVMLPSIDRVGRTFPLMLGRVGAVALWPALSSAASWFEAIEAVAFDLLENQMEPDEITQRLEAAEGLFPVGEATAEAIRQPLLDQHVPVASLAAVQVLQLAGFAGVSVWWSEGSDLVDPSLLCCRGMPSATMFPALLVGEWGNFGWGEA